MFFDDIGNIKVENDGQTWPGLDMGINPFENYFLLSNTMFPAQPLNLNFDNFYNDQPENMYFEAKTNIKNPEPENNYKDEFRIKEEYEQKYRKVSDTSKKIKRTEKKDQLTKKFKNIERVLCEKSQMLPNSVEGSKTKIDEKFEDEKKTESLALRNIKMNFGTGLLQFIDFKKSMYSLEQNIEGEQKMDQLGIWVLKNHQNFRSFEGWREMWENPEFGSMLREISLEFFGNTFAESYVLNSKIKAHYQEAYIKKILKFFCGASKPSIFTSYYFGVD